ncbi:MAG: C39 family peptidase, partial [Dehalococcoidia bacterium]
EALVLESKTQMIDSSGGSILLEDGISVVFPSGAIDSVAEMTISKIDPASYFENTSDVERVVVSCTAPVTRFSKDVEIRIPLPDGMTEADSSSVLAGVLDEPTGAVIVQPSSVRMIDGKPVLVIATNHFSNYVAEYLPKKDLSELKEAREVLPEKSGPIVIPYYSQGPTPYCWAASLQMVTQAARYHGDQETFEIIGEMAVGKSGLNIFYASDLLTPNLTRAVQKRTGLKPDRHMFDQGTAEEFKYYIKREISKQRPVVLFSNAWNDPDTKEPGHAGVIVGYDGDTLYFHDPRGGTSDNHIGYTTRTFQDFISELSVLRFWIITITIPTPDLDPGRPEVTVNITDTALSFQKPTIELGDNQTEGSKNIAFRWDYTRPQGYSFREANVNNKVYESLPGPVKQLILQGEGVGSHVEIVNSSLTAEKSVTVQMIISSKGQGGTYYSVQKEISMPPNSRRYFTLDELNAADDSPKEIEIDKFRDNNQSPTEYMLSITTLDGGSVADMAGISFSIDKEEIKISSIDPNENPAGAQVSIAGRGFGTIRGTAGEKTANSGGVSVKYLGVPSQIIFGGTPVADADVVSWEDNLIKVRVPEGATTGPVIVRRGTVESNAVSFTVESTVKTSVDSVYRSTIQKVDIISGERGPDIEAVVRHHMSWTEPAKTLIPGQPFDINLQVEQLENTMPVDVFILGDIRFGAGVFVTAGREWIDDFIKNDTNPRLGSSQQYDSFDAISPQLYLYEESVAGYIMKEDPATGMRSAAWKQSASTTFTSPVPDKIPDKTTFELPAKNIKGEEMLVIIYAIGMYSLVYTDTSYLYEDVQQSGGSHLWQLVRQWKTGKDQWTDPDGQSSIVLR